eukprot:scaffold273210_cov27-Tisochrysis_lutea.AAC.1
MRSTNSRASTLSSALMVASRLPQKDSSNGLRPSEAPTRASCATTRNAGFISTHLCRDGRGERHDAAQRCGLGCGGKLAPYGATAALHPGDGACGSRYTMPARGARGRLSLLSRARRLGLPDVARPKQKLSIQVGALDRVHVGDVHAATVGRCAEECQLLEPLAAQGARSDDEILALAKPAQRRIADNGAGAVIAVVARRAVGLGGPAGGQCFRRIPGRGEERVRAALGRGPPDEEAGGEHAPAEVAPKSRSSCSSILSSGTIRDARTAVRRASPRAGEAGGALGGIVCAQQKAACRFRERQRDRPPTSCIRRSTDLVGASVISWRGEKRRSDGCLTCTTRPPPVKRPAPGSPAMPSPPIPTKLKVGDRRRRASSCHPTPRSTPRRHPAGRGAAPEPSSLICAHRRRQVEGGKGRGKTSEAPSEGVAASPGGAWKPHSSAHGPPRAPHPVAPPSTCSRSALRGGSPSASATSNSSPKSQNTPPKSPRDQQATSLAPAVRTATESRSSAG